MPPLPPELRAAQDWMGTREAIATMDAQQLCNVRVPEDMARPWLLTVYTQRSGGALVVPTTPAGPSANAAPVYSVATVPAVLRVTIGNEMVTMDYPSRGATYGISPASQVNVALVASWAGLVEPAPHPVYSARLTEAEGSGVAQSLLATPRYTYRIGNLEVGGTFYGLVPVRAQSVTVYLGQTIVPSEVLLWSWMDESGATIADHAAKPGAGAAVGDFGGHELTPWVIPPQATQWSISLPAGVNDVANIAVVFHLAL